MKASPQEQHKLLDLQATDLALMRLNQEIVALDTHAELDEANKILAEMSPRVVEAQHNVEEATLAVSKIESDVKLVDERQARNTKLLQGSVSAKDAQSIESEVQSLHTRKNNLEDAQLELMEANESAEAAYQAVLAEEQTIISKIQSFESEKASKKADLEHEKAQILSTREQQVSTIIPELYALYERQREKYSFGASELRGQLSSIVGVELSTEDFSQIQDAPADEVIICPVSQAILVRGGSAE